MRYFLFPDEEQFFLEVLRDDYGLVPLRPANPADFVSDMRTPEMDEWRDLSRPWRYEYAFWAKAFGPIIRLGDPSPDMSPIARVALTINQEANPNWKSAIDIERMPVITLARPRWYDADHHWIIPGRLGAMRTQIKDYPQDYLTFFKSIERFLKKGGEKVNSWGIQGEGSIEFDGQITERPKNISSYLVTVWPKAAAWLRDGGKIYHWDG